MFLSLCHFHSERFVDVIMLSISPNNLSRLHVIRLISSLSYSVLPRFCGMFEKLCTIAVAIVTYFFYSQNFF